METKHNSVSVGIVGGGLAGLAAGCALAEAGHQVTLFERRPYVGGRASSYEHPGTGEVVDNCQHVLLGCCTNLVEFYERLGVSDKVRWFDELTFIEPGGRTSRMAPSSLPAPMHNVGAFLRADMLTWRDKLAISRAMFAMSRKLPEDSNEDFLAWLRRHNQTEQAIERFWKTVLVSALNEDLDRMSVHYAAQVFRESFMKSATAGRMGVPSVPLSDLYASAVDYIRTRRGEVLLRTSVSSIRPAETTVTLASSAGERQFDYVIVAVPFQSAGQLLPASSNETLKRNLQQFAPSPITGIHLWFDRQITSLPHAVLLDRTVQWLFHKSLFQENGNRPPEGSYVEVVVSASKSLVEKPRQEVIDLALRELGEFFPTVKEAKLLKATVIKEVYATYSIVPGLDRFRPAAKTEWPRLFLAGDWTATGWPATMEGAVRSGYLAAEAISRDHGDQKTFLVPDLPAEGLMKFS